MPDGPLVEVVLSPRWVLTNVVIDGAPHTVLRIQHPRFGPLDFLLAGNDAMDLAAALAKTAERRETAQMAGGVQMLMRLILLAGSMCLATAGCSATEQSFRAFFADWPRSISEHPTRPISAPSPAPTSSRGSVFLLL